MADGASFPMTRCTQIVDIFRKTLNKWNQMKLFGIIFPRQPLKGSAMREKNKLLKTIFKWKDRGQAEATADRERSEAAIERSLELLTRRVYTPEDTLRP